MNKCKKCGKKILSIPIPITNNGKYNINVDIEPFPIQSNTPTTIKVSGDIGNDQISQGTNLDIQISRIGLLPINISESIDICQKMSNNRKL
jgi:hypothetical protein